MQLVIVVLYREEQLDDILSVFAELGLENTIVIEGTRMQEVLAFDVPIFAGLAAGSLGGKRYVKILMSTCPEEGISRQIAKVAKDFDIDFSNRDVGEILTLPLKELVTAED
ncbi:MAG: hypothetical protein JW941_01285 [Candidatus Coatesbacteria bacterium]|nr:hypothetical protein [Candidatus Coatesbacteria bacterium]